MDDFEVRLTNLGVPNSLDISVSTLVTVYKGDPGANGANGAPGPGITNVVDNGDGTLTISYGDGQSVITSDLTGPPVTALDDIGDVNVTSRQTNEFLTWNGTAWVAAPLDGGTFN